MVAVNTVAVGDVVSGKAVRSNRKSVFSKARDIKIPKLVVPEPLAANTRLCMEGRDLLSRVPDEAVPAVFFDPQYRGVLDRMKYGNEGKSRCARRVQLEQMQTETINVFISDISRVLTPSGHLFLWIDKFHCCTGLEDWLDHTDLNIVDMVVWKKGRMGMGYRTRRSCEYMVILQKKPLRAKGVWQLHNIPDVWEETVPRSGHIHRKPVTLQQKLIEAVTNQGDFVIDPAAGSFSVMDACTRSERNFLGCDLAADPA